MIVVWVTAGFAVLLLLNHLSRVSSELADVTWPDEAPAGLHEERAHDQHITHLRRLLAADDPAAAHELVADLLHRMADVTADPDAPMLDDRSRAFLQHPPLASSAHYRRELDAVLRRIEAR